MAIKTTGYEFKKFYADPSIWLDDMYHEDETILVNGEPMKEGIDPDAILDTDSVSISGGYVVDPHKDIFSRDNLDSLETLFKKWKKKQNKLTSSPWLKPGGGRQSG